MQQAAAPLYIRKNSHSHKICCITYKNICIYQKKVVPLQHERNNKEISRK